MKWHIASIKSDNIVDTLLENREIKDKGDFLNPASPSEIRLDHLSKPINRIKKAIAQGEKIVVYGDYDADGICATAIVWETLHKLKANVLPFIPKREKEGYGLSKEGIDQIDATLIISVDSGISAHEAVDYAKSKNIDVIILDHHEKPPILPKAFAIVHTSELCASGIAYVFCKELGNEVLELAAIATITDLMPLKGKNRSIVKYGLEALNKTTRVGLLALFQVAGIEKIGTYEVGYMIGPRINASGRIDSALLGLRLLCTKDKVKAQEFARQIDQINKDRQQLLEDQVSHALLLTVSNNEKIIIIDDSSYHQGIIGLIAGKLTEKNHLPSIVIAKGEKTSKASARSIVGFNIIEAIREHEGLLINSGGHPLAAGFTIETEKIELFRDKIIKSSKTKITTEMLERVLEIDMELDPDLLTIDLFLKLQTLAPFGFGNPEPVFASEMTVQDLRSVGREGKHLKFKVNGLDAIAFGQGSRLMEFKIGDKVKLAYTLDLNFWNNRQNLQLKIKDIVLG